MSLLALPSTLHRLLPLRAEVDLDALRHNVRALKARAGEAEVMGVIKADAYGHGAVPVARVLAEEGVGRFAVANVPEGVELREAGLDAPVLVLGALLPEYLPACARYGLAVSVTSPDVAEAVVEAAEKAGPLTVHLKVDTGMNRLGVEPEDVPAVLARLRAAPGVAVEGIMTHFATVDRRYTFEQMAAFDALLGQLGGDAPPLVHVANSGTLLALPETVAGRALARVGGALFGLVSERVAEAEAADLRPVMRLTSRVVHVQTVAAGEAVSYGRTWVAAQPTRVAVVAGGYGDGLARALSNVGAVGVGGRLWPIAGRVCMDMLMLDLGDPGGAGAAVRPGDEAVLFGTGGPSALHVAERAGTIAYAVTCGLTARVPRVYVGVEAAGPRPEPLLADGEAPAEAGANRARVPA
ncbi:MAG TPA: alanine racemase [Rubricoccaceae bacterium]|nr:alanine racemase [Rubricoccaceae bacterium]